MITLLYQRDLNLLMNKVYNDDESKLVDDDATNYMVADMH